ncbi:Uncharacterised protein [Mycobacteroides abscessus subsp. abscessus]|nr:Uncharacterised protein [Mycobacteroides abscessus subsp. abscessus]
MLTCARRVAGSRAAISVPSISIWPLSGSCRPAMSDKMVLFPEPDGPMMAVVVPGSRVKLMPLSTCSPASR